MHDQADELREWMRHAASERTGTEARSPYLLAVGSGKGGVGTTTVAARTATSLARMGNEVLLVDADPQRADVAAFCGLEPARSLADVLLGRCSIDEIIARGPSGVGVVAGPWASALVADCPPQGCERLIEQLRGTEFSAEWIILDTGSGISQVARRFRLASDGVLMVTTPDPVAVMDTYAAIKHLSAAGKPPEIECVVNAATTSAEALDAFDRLANACRRFLGFDLIKAGWISRDDSLREQRQTCHADEQGSRHSEWSRSMTLLAEGLVLRAASREAGGDRMVSGRRGAGLLKAVG